jgi:hypothetical protein
MKNITQEMLEMLIQKLQSARRQEPQTNVAKGLDIPGAPIPSKGCHGSSINRQTPVSRRITS